MTNQLIPLSASVSCVPRARPERHLTDERFQKERRRNSDELRQ